MRGDTLEQEVDLRGHTVRIGRGSTNDLVLEDPGKSVSRNHAEIRFQGGRYELVDLQSQNGIWVSGSRMTNVVLEPNVVATIGPFRLLLERAGDTSEVPSAQYEPGPSETEYGGEAPSHPPDSAAEPRPQGARRGVIAKPWFVQYQKPLIGGAALLALGGGVWTAVASRSGAGTPDYVARLSDAEEMIANGSCTQALTEIIHPALQQSPGNAEAIRLAADAESCGEPPPVPPTPNEGMSPEAAALHLQQARDALAARPRNCSAAQDEIALILAADPDNQQAVELQREAQACVTPPPAATDPPRRPAPPVGGGPARVVAAEEGGLSALPNETNDDYQARVQAIQARFSDADALVAKGDLKRALALFEGIAQMATDRYHDRGDRSSGVAERIRTVTARLKDQAQKIRASAAALEQRGEFVRAIEEYERAAQTDSEVDVVQDVARVNVAKTAAGQKACQDADVRYSFNRFSEAADLYKRAAELLPTGDPCYAKARDRAADGRGKQ